MTINIQVKFQSIEEKRKIAKAAKKQNLSISNFIRARLNLPMIARGGARANGGRKRKSEAQL